MKDVRILFEQDPTVQGVEVRVRAAERNEDIEALIRRLSDKSVDMLTVTGEDGALIRIPMRDIISVSVSGKQIGIVTENGCYSSRQSLQSMEKTLDGRQFVRISRFEMVNLDKVRKFDFTLSGTLRLELENGTETWASRRCIPQIRRRLNGEGGSGC